LLDLGHDLVSLFQWEDIAASRATVLPSPSPLGFAAPAA
jgi:hypothetical protein